MRINFDALDVSIDYVPVGFRINPSTKRIMGSLEFWVTNWGKLAAKVGSGRRAGSCGTIDWMVSEMHHIGVSTASPSRLRATKRNHSTSTSSHRVHILNPPHGGTGRCRKTRNGHPPSLSQHSEPSEGKFPNPNQKGRFPNPNRLHPTTTTTKIRR